MRSWVLCHLVSFQSVDVLSFVRQSGERTINCTRFLYIERTAAHRIIAGATCPYPSSMLHLNSPSSLFLHLSNCPILPSCWHQHLLLHRTYRWSRSHHLQWTLCFKRDQFKMARKESTRDGCSASTYGYSFRGYYELPQLSLSYLVILTLHSAKTSCERQGRTY